MVWLDPSFIGCERIRDVVKSGRMHGRPNGRSVRAAGREAMRCHDVGRRGSVRARVRAGPAGLAWLADLAG